MSGFFSESNFIFRLCGKLLDVILLSALFLLCSLPVVTIGPAAAALYYSCVKCLRRGEAHPYGSFFSSFRENLRVGIPATLLFLAAGLALDALYLFFVMAAQSGGGWAALGVAYRIFLLIPMGVLFLTFPLLSRFTCTLGGLLSSALRLALYNLPVTLALAAINGVLVSLTLRGWYFGAMLLTPAAGALLSSLLLEPVFKKSTPEESGAEDDGGEDEKPWYLR